jgi:hypothetical protein
MLNYYFITSSLESTHQTCPFMPPEEEKIPLEQAPFFSPEMPSNHQSNENCKSEKTNPIQKDTAP